MRTLDIIVQVSVKVRDDNSVYFCRGVSESKEL